MGSGNRQRETWGQKSPQFEGTFERRAPPSERPRQTHPFPTLTKAAVKRLLGRPPLGDRIIRRTAPVKAGGRISLHQGETPTSRTYRTGRRSAVRLLRFSASIFKSMERPICLLISCILSRTLLHSSEVIPSKRSASRSMLAGAGQTPRPRHRPGPASPRRGRRTG